MREKAVHLLNDSLQSEHLIKHSYSVEYAIRELANKLEPQKEKEWALTGFVHDFDIDILDYKNNEEEVKNHDLKKFAEVVNRDTIRSFEEFAELSLSAINNISDVLGV